MTAQVVWCPECSRPSTIEPGDPCPRCERSKAKGADQIVKLAKSQAPDLVLFMGGRQCGKSDQLRREIAQRDPNARILGPGDVYIPDRFVDDLVRDAAAKSPARVREIYTSDQVAAPTHWLDDHARKALRPPKRNRSTLTVALAVIFWVACVVTVAYFQTQV